MRIQVGQHRIDKFEEVSVLLKYDSIADTFSFKLPFDPDNAAHKAIFAPGVYNDCKIYHTNAAGEDELVLVGKSFSPEISDSSLPSMSLLCGYSTTGLFHDCSIFAGTLKSPTPISTTTEVDTVDGSIQYANMSLAQIAKTIINAYGFPDPVIDDNVKEECDKIFATTQASASESVEDFLADLAQQRNVVLSHTVDGKVLLTKCKAYKNTKSVDIMQAMQPTPVAKDIPGAPTFIANGNRSIYFDSTPIYHFKQGQMIWTNMRFKVDGQKLYSNIQVLSQQIDANVADESITNPYVQNTFRYKRIVQSSGDDNDTPLTARNVLSEDLKAISLEIDIVGWELNKKLVWTNQIVVVTNPNVYCYNDIRWFIQDVQFNQNAKGTYATLVCKLPEAYNNEPVTKNVFL